MVNRECAYEGCDREEVIKGLCRGHNLQRHRGKALAPLRQYNKSKFSDESGRVCTGCGRYKLHDDYYTGKSRCKKCIIKQNVLINQRRNAA